MYHIYMDGFTVNGGLWAVCVMTVIGGLNIFSIVVFILVLALYISRDRCSSPVNQGVLHGVINSFVNVEEYKKKDPLKVCVNTRNCYLSVVTD